MIVKDLIELLKKANPFDEVKFYNNDSEQLECVSGMIYGGGDNIVELLNDDIEFI